MSIERHNKMHCICANSSNNKLSSFIIRLFKYAPIT